MDSELQGLKRDWEATKDPSILFQLSNMMLRQGWLSKWERVLTHLDVFHIEQGGRSHNVSTAEWSLVDDRQAEIYELGKQVWRNFEKRRIGAWTSLNLGTTRGLIRPEDLKGLTFANNYAQFREFLSSAVILKESHPRSRQFPGGVFELNPLGLNGKRTLLYRDPNSYYLIRAIATHRNRGIEPTWEEFAAHPETKFAFIIEFLPFAKLVPKILDPKSNLNNVIEAILSRYPNRNPLEPRIPMAPPWNPKATASGVYVSDRFARATDYALLIGEDTDSKPVVIGIESAGLIRHPDPQAIDLLAEPYDYYRRDLLNYVRDRYFEKILDLRSRGITGDARKELLGKYQDFAFQTVTKEQSYFRPATAQYTIGTSEKVEAAYAIFPESYTWNPLQAFHDYYRAEAPAKIWSWLNWREDSEESPYSSESLYCPLGSQIPTPILNLLSGMFYFDSEIGWDRIAGAWFVDEDNTRKKFIDNFQAQQLVFHGTSLSRFREAFPNLIP